MDAAFVCGNVVVVQTFSNDWPQCTLGIAQGHVLGTQCGTCQPNDARAASQFEDALLSDVAQHLQILVLWHRTTTCVAAVGMGQQLGQRRARGPKDRPPRQARAGRCRAGISLVNYHTLVGDDWPRELVFCGLRIARNCCISVAVGGGGGLDVSVD